MGSFSALLEQTYESERKSPSGWMRIKDFWNTNREPDLDQPKVRGVGSTKLWLYNNYQTDYIKYANIYERHPKPGWSLPGLELGVKIGRNETKDPQNLLSTHHQESHRNRCFCTLRQPSHDQPKWILSFPWSKDALHFISLALVCAVLLLVRCIDFWIFRRPS